MSKKPDKLTKIMDKVRTKLLSGKYMYVGHANLRLQQREVTRLEVKQVLKNGHHEKKKDEYKPEHNAWNYAVRGKTIDGRTLRVALTFDKNDMLIITVIDLDK